MPNLIQVEKDLTEELHFINKVELQYLRNSRESKKGTNTLFFYAKS